MAGTKTTTLPNVLKEYNSEFDEQKKSNRKGGHKKSEHHGNQRSNTDGDKPRENPPMPKEQTRQSRPAPLSRESTFVIKQRQEKERKSRMFEFWESLKEDLRDQEADRLKERVSLQHELIKAQDRQHQLKRQAEIQRYYKKKQKEKAERNAKTEALQQICRQSLEDDRQARAEKRADRQQRELQKAATRSGSLPDIKVADIPTSDTIARSPPDTSAHQSLASGSIYLPASSTADGSGEGGLEDIEVFRTLREEDEDGEEAEEEEDIFYGDDQLLPWHHIQLYQLYGHQADYFLHPKIDTVQKTQVQLNPRLKAIGGRAGAATLWNVLRNESRMRLLRQDSKLLSPELKSAFGAFAREGLSKRRHPVRRNYYSSDDVPDMARLMDQSKVRDAQEFRHRVELMFRSSNINKDRTKVLLYNNPPPDLNNQEGEESVQRYMPSWAEDQSDKESDLSYKKWLKPKSPGRDSATSTPPPTPGATQDWDAILQKRAKRRQMAKQEQPKYFFLTEEGATCQGEFTKRHKDWLEKDKPQPHGEVLPPKSQSAMAAPGRDHGDTARSGSVATTDDKDVASQRPHTDMSSEFRSQWEPLSLNALVEYKENKQALGHGRFNQGKTAVWSTGKVAA